MRARRLAPLFSLILLVTAGACGTAREPEEHAADPVAQTAAREDDPTPVGPDPRDRDAWSKPEMVYDFVEIQPGDTVLDLSRRADDYSSCAPASAT